MLLAVVFMAVHHHQPGPVFETERAQLAPILPHLSRQPFPCLGIFRTLLGLIKLLLADGATFQGFPSPMARSYSSLSIRISAVPMTLQGRIASLGMSRQTYPSVSIPHCLAAFLRELPFAMAISTPESRRSPRASR